MTPLIASLICPPRRREYMTPPLIASHLANDTSSHLTSGYTPLIAPHLANHRSSHLISLARYSGTTWPGFVAPYGRIGATVVEMSLRDGTVTP